MSLYQLPEIKTPQISLGRRSSFFWLLLFLLFFSTLFGFLGGALFSSYFFAAAGNHLPSTIFDQRVTEDESPFLLPPRPLSQEEQIVRAVEEVSPSVVSIIVSKDLPVFEEFYFEPFGEFKEFFGPQFEFKIPQLRQKGTEKREIGGGTGFMVSQDGLILTNKHVVSDVEADYTVLTNDGRRLEVEVLARDPGQDLAILKITTPSLLPVVKLSNSDDLKIGQMVIAIGNVLGEFRNSVSVGVISGLGRSIRASGGGVVQTLEDVIQTDAAINRGNSGGPLLSLKGEVIGINTAMATEAENIGFAIPINQAKRDIEQVKSLGRIVYPFLGIYYTIIDASLQQEFDLPVDYGAWVGRDRAGTKTEIAIIPNTPAEAAGLKQDDIILEFNGEKITSENHLAKIIIKYNPGDGVGLKILRKGVEKTIEITLAEKSG